MSDTGSDSPKSFKNIPNSINMEQTGNNDDNKSSSGTEVELTKSKEELDLSWPKPVHDLRRTPVENLDRAESELSGTYGSINGTSIVNVEHGLNRISQEMQEMVQSFNGSIEMENNRSSTGNFLKKEENKSQVPEVTMVNNGSIRVSESLISDRSFRKQKEVATLEYYSDSEVGDQVEKMNTRSGKVVGVKYVIKNKSVKRKTMTNSVVHGKTEAVVTNEEFKGVNSQAIKEAEQKIKQQLYEAELDQKMEKLKRDRDMAEQRIRDFDEAMRFLEVDKRRVELENKSVIEMIEIKRIEALEQEKIARYLKRKQEIEEIEERTKQALKKINQRLRMKSLERDQEKQKKQKTDMAEKLRKLKEKKSNKNGSEIESYVTTRSKVMSSKDESVLTWVEQHRSVSQAETLSMTSGSSTYSLSSSTKVTNTRRVDNIITNRLQRDREAKIKSREARAKEAKRLAEKVEKYAERKARKDYDRFVSRKLKREERRSKDPYGRRRKKEKKKKSVNSKPSTYSEETTSSDETYVTMQQESSTYSEETTSSDETYVTMKKESSTYSEE